MRCNWNCWRERGTGVSTRVRDLRGKFVSRKEARVIAAQVTSLPVEEPRVPEFAARGPHWHEDCEECYPVETLPPKHRPLPKGPPNAIYRLDQLPFPRPRFTERVRGWLQRRGWGA